MPIDEPQLLAQVLVQVIEITPQPVDLEKARRLRGVVTQMSLCDEKVRFALGGPGDDVPPGHASASRVH